MAGAVDAIVIGAGFSGLSAAVTLKRAGLDVRVLEARPRIGGRVEGRRDAFGSRIDMGGQFLCEDMPAIMALAQRFGGLAVTPAGGRTVHRPPLAEEAAAKIDGEARALRRQMKTIGHDEAGERSVADWLAGEAASAEAKAAFRSWIEGLWCQALEEIPLAYLADSDRRVTNAVGELQYFPAATMHGVAEGLAGELGEAVLTEHEALRIHRGPDGVRVETNRGTFAAGAAILAVPPVAASRIGFAPGLPASLAGALNGWRSGDVIKALVRYDRRFWTDEGLSGTVMSRDPAAFYACDASREGEDARLVVFAGGPLARRWSALGTEGIRRKIVELLAEALGPRAAEVTDFQMRDWCDDRWSGGGYSDVLAKADAAAERVLCEGWPPLYFAASELSPSFPGYVEGALIAGRLAAERLLGASAEGAYSWAIATSASGS